MVKDRKIISWDDTTKSFQAKSYVEIFNMLLENYRAIYGQEIDLTVETPFGEELRMKAEQLYDFAKIAEDVYYTLDVNNAKGAVLDNVVNFTSNIVRKTNIQTVLNADLKFVGDNLDTSINNVYLQDEYGMLWKVEGTNGSTVISGGTDIGSAPANKVKLTCSEYGENILPELSLQLLVNSSYYTAELNLSQIIYVQIGSIIETDEMLRLRKNNTLSYNSVALLDSIRDYILKNIHSIKDVMIYNANGRKTGDTFTTATGDTLLDLQTSDGVKSLVLSRRDLLVLVQPQTGLGLDSFIDVPTSVLTNLSVAIAQVLKAKITPGISTAPELMEYDPVNEVNVGPVSVDEYINVPIIQTYGSNVITEDYRFFVVQKYSPAISVTLTRKLNYDSVTTQKRIRDAIYQLSTTYTINKNIEIDEVLTVIRQCNLDVNNPTFSVKSITIGSGSDIEVNNGYWLVDKTVDTPGTEWGITIVED